MRSLRATLVLSALLLAGCHGPATPTDTAAGPDVPSTDVGPVDAPVTDGGADAGPDGGGMDAPIAMDGGGLDDGSIGGEGGVADGSIGGEGGVSDGAIGGEGGVSDGAIGGEGGVGDGSIGGEGGVGDGGPLGTTCSIEVTPTEGELDDDFTFDAASNGTGCTAVLDGSVRLTVPCTATMSLAGSAIGAGDHVIELEVSDGPGGPVTCSASFTVTDPGPSTTSCTMDITPTSGSTATTFTATYASDGSDCSLSVGIFPIGTVPCTGSYMGMGSLLGPGTYTGTLTVGDGPGGPTSCSDTFTVTP